MGIWNDSLFPRDSKSRKTFFPKSNQIPKRYVEVHCAVIEYENEKAK